MDILNQFIAKQDNIPTVFASYYCKHCDTIIDEYDLVLTYEDRFKHLMTKLGYHLDSEHPNLIKDSARYPKGHTYFILYKNHMQPINEIPFSWKSKKLSTRITRLVCKIFYHHWYRMYDDKEESLSLVCRRCGKFGLFHSSSATTTRYNS